MKHSYIITLIILFTSCASHKINYSKVEITPILKKENIGVRALEIENSKVYFAGRKGWIGEFNIENSLLKTFQIDSTSEFRSLGFHGDKIYISNILSPAKIYAGIDIKKLSPTIIDRHDNAFYDAMSFNEKGIGFIIGDPTQDCLSVQKTNDFGKTWQKIPCNKFPKSKNGEAAFAASNTNIKMIEDNIWMASGGKASRIYKSIDSGNNWVIFDTPIIQGTETTGMYSLDFYDKKIGIAIGGDYTKPDNNQNNLIKTTNGGKTWKLLNDASHPGYRSCIQFIPNSNGKGVVAVGFKGIDISNDGGKTWKHISDQSIYTIRFINKKTAFAGGKSGVYRIDFNP